MTGPAADELLDVPRVPWSTLGPEFVRAWGYPRGKRQAEGVEILGQNGSGKSYFEAMILLQRQQARGSHILVILTKPADETLEGLGWPIIDRYPPRDDDPRQTAHILWLPSEGLDQEGQIAQAQQIYRVLTRIWRRNANIIIVFDEIAYLCEELDLPRHGAPLRTVLVRIYREGRGMGITPVATTQRPQGVIRQIHSESLWVVCFAPSDEDDGERMAQVLGSKKTYLPILKTLNRQNYEFLIKHRITGKMYISWIDIPLPLPAGTRRDTH